MQNPIVDLFGSSTVPPVASTRDPRHIRALALEAVRKLRAAGYQALWAGGCVRDRLLARTPKDYDIATDATPEQIRDVFGHRRTLAIGQAFGVICLILPRGAGQIDIATFRRDAAYSDGRHPDHVTFSTAQDDAQRRDFTINGLFYDPVGDRVIDYVGGQEDLRRRLVRAIGDPHERFAEDKLRMLRAVRMAATFDFDIEDRTMQAIEQHAGQLVVVSAERITAELRQILVHERRRRAVELLDHSRLLTVILPELAPVLDRPDAWPQTLEILDRLQRPTFAAAFAALLRDAARTPPERLARIGEIAERLRWTRQERRDAEFFLVHETAIRQAHRWPWPRLQRILVQPQSCELLNYARAVAEVVDRDTAPVGFCEQQLQRPPEELDPPPLLTGSDLLATGAPPGPRYAQILESVRDAQLEGRITSRDQALQLARTLLTDSQTCNGANGK